MLIKNISLLSFIPLVNQDIVFRISNFRYWVSNFESLFSNDPSALSYNLFSENEFNCFSKLSKSLSVDNASRSNKNNSENILIKMKWTNLTRLWKSNIQNNAIVCNLTWTSVSKDIIVHNKSNEPKLKYFLKEWSVWIQKCSAWKKTRINTKKIEWFLFFFLTYWFTEEF